MDAMSSELLVNVADYASLQTDRWLFVALLIIMMVAFTWVVRYFVAQVSKVQEKADATTREFNAHLQSGHRELISIIAETNRTTSKHTEVLERITTVLQNFLTHRP
jgi:type VI protein secretion system component VasK